MNKQHERIVQKLVRNLIKDGCPPSHITISARQNKGLEAWAKRKGIVFSKTQKHDISHPEQYSMETKTKIPRVFLNAFK